MSEPLSAEGEGGDGLMVAELAAKVLSSVKVGDGAALSCDDFVQQLELRLTVRHE